MDEYSPLVAQEIRDTLDRAAFDGLSLASFRIDVTDSFQRKLVERPADLTPGTNSTE